MKKSASSHRDKPAVAAPRPTATLPPATALRSAPSTFPIVGIGAEAGGLEALEQFLHNMPADSGLGFVIVQHLDPTHKALLVELLQRTTAMPVVQIKDRLLVRPNHVYVIPPNRDLSLLHGMLHLHEPSALRGLRLPIDSFFRSLADDWRERSIGVILSGMGADGTLGLRAIKEKAGVGFVQAPDSTQFDSMPRSAIDAGLADVVATPSELPGKILAYLQHLGLERVERLLPEQEHSELEKVVILLRVQTGHDLSLYKKSTIYRRIERRMGLHQIDKIADYVRFLRENGHEAELLFKELLIGVTRFFRDPEVWEQLKSELIPKLLSAHAEGATLRAWTPGCSTGEEAYSLGMVFREALELYAPGRNLTLQIFATDLDKDALERARRGVYPSNIAADVTDERLRRFFDKNDRGYRVTKEIREMVLFAPQNLVMDPPFTKLDILTCRNLLIYFSTELQKKLIPLFHYSLNPGGILALGSAETIGKDTDLFVPQPGKTQIYRRLDSTLGMERIEFPSAAARARLPPGLLAQTSGLPAVPKLQLLVEQILLLQYGPAAVLVTEEGDILYFCGKTGQYLEPPAGRANLNLFAMAREGLHYRLSESFRKALRERITVRCRGVEVGREGSTQLVDVTIQPLTEPEALRGMVMVVFVDVATAKSKAPIKSARAQHDAQLATLMRDLQQSREELKESRAEMQTSGEELKSINEELQSTNEELQSSNEELTTSKEEMQSMNEELQTVNHELQAKLDELSESTNDTKNLLDSTDLATLFLDNGLHVRRFTPQMAKIIRLIPSDAGRYLTDFAIDLDYPGAGLAEDAREVLRTLVYKERQVAAHDKSWFRVRIMPYRTLENRIDGLVITFTDITEAKTLAAELRRTEARLRELLVAAAPKRS